MGSVVCKNPSLPQGKIGNATEQGLAVHVGIGSFAATVLRLKTYHALEEAASCPHLDRGMLCPVAGYHIQ